MAPAKLKTLMTSVGSRPAALAASSINGLCSRYWGLSQSAPPLGIHPSARRPVTASDRGPRDPVQIGGVATGAGSRPDTV